MMKTKAIDLVCELEAEFGSVVNVPETNPKLKLIRKILEPEREIKSYKPKAYGTPCKVIDTKTGETHQFHSMREASYFYGHAQNWAGNIYHLQFKRKQRYRVIKL